MQRTTTSKRQGTRTIEFRPDCADTSVRLLTFVGGICLDTGSDYIGTECPGHQRWLQRFELSAGGRSLGGNASVPSEHHWLHGGCLGGTPRSVHRCGCSTQALCRHIVPAGQLGSFRGRGTWEQRPARVEQCGNVLLSFRPAALLTHSIFIFVVPCKSFPWNARLELGGRIMRAIVSGRVLLWVSRRARQ